MKVPISDDDLFGVGVLCATAGGAAMLAAAFVFPAVCLSLAAVLLALDFWLCWWCG